MRIFSFFVITVSIFFSCDSKRVYEENLDLTDQFWLKDSIYTFHFDVPDAKKDYRILFNVRNTVDYKYYNLFVKYHLQGNSGVDLSKMEEFYLFDKSTGNPFGSGLGDIFDHRMPFIDSIRFDSVGEHQVSLQHYMRPDSLQEVLSIGVRLEEL